MRSSATGYRAIYATDEVRFANFDRSFGFDEMITPPIGASDFVLGYVGDMPLVNLVAARRSAAGCFPVESTRTAPPRHLSARAFRRAARARTEDRGPELSRDPPDARALALRLGRANPPTTPQAYRAAYREALDRSRPPVRRRARAAGAQGRARQCDRRRALGSRRGARRPIETRCLRKTGTARRDLGFALGPWHERHEPAPVPRAARDARIRPRATSRARPEATTGRSRSKTCDRRSRNSRPAQAPRRCRRHLARCPIMGDPALAGDTRRRVSASRRPISTPTKMLTGTITSFRRRQRGRHLLRDSTPKSGWVQLRADRLPETAGAEAAGSACRGTRCLAAIPSSERRLGHATCYADRRTPAPRRPGRPSGSLTTDPEAARLWDALTARFPGELPPLGRDRPECEPGQGLVGRTMGAFRAHLTIAGTVG